MSESRRVSPTQIPSMLEIEKILSQESPRTIPEGKLEPNKSLINVHYLKQLLNSFNISYDVFLLEFSGQIEDYLSHSIKLLSQLCDVILQSDLEQSQVKSLDDVYQYLTEGDNDAIIKGSKIYDIGLVFGSQSQERIKQAVYLYDTNKISKIVVSGKSAFYRTHKISEAETFAHYALSQGVPDEKIIVENKSITIRDNVKRSLDLLEEKNIEYESIVLITAPFAMRRSHIALNSYLKKEHHKQILRSPSKVSESFSSNNWYKSERTLRIVLNEYFKIIGEWYIDKAISETGSRAS